MIGGSLDAFIGAVHRKAAALDGEIELVCGAFSSDPKKSKATGEALYLNPHRVYGSYAEMIEKEKNLPALHLLIKIIHCIVQYLISIRW